MEKVQDSKQIYRIYAHIIHSHKNEKSDKNDLRNISKRCAHFQTTALTPIKFQRYWKKLYEELPTQGTYCLKGDRSTECLILCPLVFFIKSVTKKTLQNCIGYMLYMFLAVVHLLFYISISNVSALLKHFLLFNQY